MGAGMARRLLGRGDDVIVWNRTPVKSEQLKAEFAGRVTVAASPKEVVEQCGGCVFLHFTQKAGRATAFSR